MDKKKGNTVIIMLIFTLLIMTFVGAFIAFNHIIGENIKNIKIETSEKRVIENKAYDFYISSIMDSDLFVVEDNYIIYKENTSFKYIIYDDNGVINIRRIEEE